VAGQNLPATIKHLIKNDDFLKKPFVLPVK